MGQELLAPPPCQPEQQQSVISHEQQGSLLLPSYSCAIRSVNYDNRAFSAVEEQSTDIVPSISMAVYENEISSHQHECQTGGDNNEDDGIVMLHL